MSEAKSVGWAKRSVPTTVVTEQIWWARREERLCPPYGLIISATRPIALRSTNSRIARA
jgi:hypothetical protein